MSSHLQHKLYQFESAPPASVWEGVEAALDRQAASYARKLYQYQQTPPAATWQQVSAALDSPADRIPAPVVPLWRTKVARTAAAAAVLLLVVTGVYYLINQNANHPLAGSATAPAVPRVLRTQTPPPVNQTAQSAPAPKTGGEEPAQEAPEYIVVQKQPALPRQKPVQYASAVYLPEEENSLSIEPYVEPKEKSLINEALADRYMIVTSADGAAVRLPKKAYSDYACATQAALSLACKEKISTLQSRMAAAMTTDFAQLIDLLQNLQENR